MTPPAHPELPPDVAAPASGHASRGGSVALATRGLRTGREGRAGGDALEGTGRCEVCGAVGRLRCGSCRVTFYCSVDHQQADWVSIHQQICPLLVPIRTPLPFLPSEEERKRGAEQLEERKKQLTSLAQSRSQELVLDGKAAEAIPAALHALRFGTELHGPDSVHLVPAYLVLALASTGKYCLNRNTDKGKTSLGSGIGHLQEASKYLSQAEWIVLRTPDCSAALQSKLQRGLGLFCVAKGNFEQALYHLANDIYLASSAFGLKSTELSGGYFHMANIFLQQDKMDVANSLYAEVTSIWHAFLLKSVQAPEQILKSEPEMSLLSQEREGSEGRMTGAQKAEAFQVLSAVLDIREQTLKQQPGETARVLHALAMLHYLNMDFPRAHEVGLKALDLQKQLPQQESLETIDHLLKLINSQLSSTK